MNRKIYALITSLVIISSVFSLVGTAGTTADIQAPLPLSSTIYVDDDNTEGPWDGSPEHPYQTIQDGVYHASVGDTVYVFSGTYTEQVSIGITSLSLIGEDANTVIVDGTTSDYTMYVGAYYVNISSITVKNGYYGMRLENAQNSTISGCIISTSTNGISLWNSPSVLIIDCTIFNTSEVGVHVYASNDVQISQSTIFSTQTGIYFTESTTAMVEGCEIFTIYMLGFANGGVGIYLGNAPGCTISNSSISNCSDIGIWTELSGQTNVFNCTFFDNVLNPDLPFPPFFGSYCIKIAGSPDCMIEDSTFTENDNGLFIGSAQNLYLRNNTFVDNTKGSFEVKAGTVEDVWFDIDTSNMINGEPIVYHVGESGLTIDGTETISFLGLVACTNITVTDIDLNGLLMFGTENSALINVSSHGVNKGFYVQGSPNCVITNCEAYDCYQGIQGSSAEMTNCQFYDNEYGLYLKKEGKTEGNNRGVNGGNITNCSAYNNRVGFHEAKGSTITGCQAYNNTEYGFLLAGEATSPEEGSTLRDNRFYDNSYNFFAMAYNAYSLGFSDIDYSNTVDDRPIYYLANERDRVIDGSVEDVGVVVLASCDNITVKNVQTTANKHGILLVGTMNSKVMNSSFFGNQDGIWLCYESNYNSILSCQCFDNERGIALQESCHENVFAASDLYNNSKFGYWCQAQTVNNRIVGCTVHDNGYAYSEEEAEYPLSLQYGGPGIMIHLWSAYTSIENCQVYNNYEGIYIYDYSELSVIRNCTLYNNTMNGLCLYQNEFGCVVDNCTSYGNKYGFSLVEGPYTNTITNCSAYQNEIGMYITRSANDNQLYHNNFYQNNQNALDRCSNIWDRMDPNGGNYWDDYTGVDADGDGIGDTPYPIPGGSNEDRYPYMDYNGWGRDSEPPVISAVFPGKGLYFNDKKIIPLSAHTVIIKGVWIKVNVSDNQSQVQKVEVYIDDTLKTTMTEPPYEWKWDEKTPFKFRHQIDIKAYDTAGNTAEASLKVWKFL